MRNPSLQGNKEKNEKTDKKKCEARRKRRLDQGKKLAEQFVAYLLICCLISVMIPLNIIIVIFAKNHITFL